MLLSRFWYFIVALGLAASAAGLFVATSVYNRTSREAMNQALAADTQVVSWYLNEDARRRSSLLLKACLDETIRKDLVASNKDGARVPPEVGKDIQSALQKLSDSMARDSEFSALFAVDQFGRVVGQTGFDQASGLRRSDDARMLDFELGGYPVVADALHGWVRDDSWVLDGTVYLVVARPVEVDTAQMPAGAVVGLRVVDASYVRQISKRTGSAVGFFAEGVVKAKAAPEGFDTARLDTVMSDIRNLAQDESYQEKGKSKPKVLMGEVGVIYSKIPGEAWDLGAGYVVGRVSPVTTGMLGVLQLADAEDKKAVPWWLVGGLFLGASLIGLVLTLVEHTRPLRTLRTEAERLAKGETDMLQVSRFRGLYRKIASDLNDGMEKVAAKGGVPRKAADLEQVLGPIPAQPAMSAFAFPLEASDAAEPPVPPPPRSGAVAVAAPVAPAPKPAAPPPPAAAKDGSKLKPPPPPALRSSSSGTMPAVRPPSSAGMPAVRPPSSAGMPAVRPSNPGTFDRVSAGNVEVTADSSGLMSVKQGSDDEATVVSAVPQEILEASATGGHEAVREADEVAEWHGVFEEFLRTKKQCSEPTAGLTFEKFQVTLRKNRDQLVEKTGCKRVRFSVYVKDGRAALKASPIRK